MVHYHVRIPKDYLVFSATKNGCLAAEAVVVFHPALAETMALRRKRAGHLFYKQRFLSAQLDAYLTGDLWLRNARHANAMAARLSAGLAALPEPARELSQAITVMTQPLKGGEG